MTKEEYKTKKAGVYREMAELENKINALRAEVRDLNALYLEANKPYPEGTRVIVDGKTPGIVTGFRISGDYIEPIVSKVKKDGTASAHKLWMWHSTKVEVAP